ncbi:hypothetical protein [Amycolatopsis sp. NPDC051371]|uniref:hypothetical protein n=1 Tax=Amycolatopsis sp. NPDC051371 TaxID=3155800 RepID=UPI00343F88A5
MSLPTYLAAILTQVEEASIQRDVALLAGEDQLAGQLEEQIAGRACIALTRARDELHIPYIKISLEDNDFIRNGGGVPGITMDKFIDTERHVLQLVGLTEDLASKHVDLAFETFKATRTVIRNEADVLTALTAGAEAACAIHRSLVEARRAAEVGRRRRRRLLRILVALGGAVIAVANPLAAPLIGPLIVPLSVALGSGAAGAVANLVED